jgi:hypothetical protein
METSTYNWPNQRLGEQKKAKNEKKDNQTKLKQLQGLQPEQNGRMKT